MNTRNPDLKTLWLAGALMIAPWTASAQTGAAGINFVEDATAQFEALSRRGDGLAFAMDNAPDSTLCQHYQGMARYSDGGTPYLFVSQSGNDPGATCYASNSDHAGFLLIVSMGSRDTDGERLRTNRLHRNWNPARGTKPPDPRDAVVGYISFSGYNGWPAYHHPGGMQIVGDVLAVALETPIAGLKAPANLIQFIDISNPVAPRKLSAFKPHSSDDYSAGLLGLTPVRNPVGPGYRYLLLTTGGDNDEVRLYRSKPTEADGSTDLKSSAIKWELLRMRTEFELEDCFEGDEDWPSGTDAFQSLNFVRERSLDGALYLVGARNTGFGGEGDDYLNLYRVNVDKDGNPGSCLLTPVTYRHVTSFPFNGHGDSAALSAASGTYVSPSGELIVYGTEYENDGPRQLNPDGSLGRRTVRFSEWRHIDVVRPGSPARSPTIDVQNSSTTWEGGSAILRAEAAPPLARPWIALFEDDGSGNSIPGELDDDDWMMVDYADWDRDHFDDFSLFDYITDTDRYNDNAGSWRWYAPAGCTLRANEDQFGASTGVFPGRHTRTLRGDGAVHVDRDLDRVSNDRNDAAMDDKISSVQFFTDCGAYYKTPPSIFWDLDIDGDFETPGDRVTFDAAQLDGPVSVTVPLRANIESDGMSVAATTLVNVRNVAPLVAIPTVRDAYGRMLGAQVPMVLAGQAVRFEASFTDPGRPDRQTATIAWGDSVIDSQAAFAQFNDAFGGATGRLRQDHTYASTGTFRVRLTVTDDDGGATRVETSVTVATPLGVLQEVIRQLNLRISATRQAPVVNALASARDALAGERNGATQNGAVQYLPRKEWQLALQRMRTAVQALGDAERAEAGSMDVLENLIAQVAESVTRQAYERARASAGRAPTAAQAQQLDAIRLLIEKGHAQVVAARHVEALDVFRDATCRALAMQALGGACVGAK